MFEAIGAFFLKIFYPLELGVAWVMVQFHDLLTTLGMDPTSGWTWSLSIVGLVIVLRILLIPLFFKQIKASRGMQLLQPEMRKIQQKYKGRTDPESRQAMSRETMELYRAHGTNPFSSCLPALLQAPFFFALFRVLNNRISEDGDAEGIGVLTGELANQAAASDLFGAQLTDTFLYTSGFAAKAVTLTLIILMSLTMFLTQRQLMMKNMPASALDNPFAQQQKVLLYAFPVIFLVTGVNFPLGVLVYWLTTNLWTGAQQFYVIRRMPAPGSPAEKALAERRARRGKGLPGAVAGPGGTVATAGGPTDGGPPAPRAGGPVSGQRQQPKRKNRGARPPGGSSGSRRGPQPEPGS
jgi:YidC/Oxa1 family membrane protein insertase